ncbi:MAG: aminotransferase class I/II-fold pyridoxal phosphate-dependent enzyme [Peptostreptococcaceae bacterium]|nr:aminotransferase class I/II-fold pyridoxal phosphate-dependent enzyme [Peptostreptococcaceae bacterium]
MRNNIILNRLVKIGKREPVSFHVPGHKNGRIFSDIPVFKEMGKLDFTELSETDNLHDPKGLILEAQRRASKVYGAMESFFLVNGTTGGILAAISAMATPGDRVLLQRDCHRSVFHGIAINGLEPVYIKPKFSASPGRKLSIEPGQVEEAFKANPQISLVILTYPSYDGICFDIEAITKIVHEKGALLLVDSAHGSHLGFSELFPDSPLKFGADVVVQSTHKTLPAFTQGSMLHINSKRVNISRMRRMLSVYQSSSPSYLLMAGIDSAMEIMEKEGRFLMERLFGEIGRFAEGLKKNTDIKIWERKTLQTETRFDLDESKILLDFSRIGISGFCVEEILRKKYEIYVEMAGRSSALLVSSVANSKNDFARAEAALESIASDKSLYRMTVGESEYSYRIPEMAILPGNAFYKTVREVPLLEAEGMISGGYLMPYPPGIPLVCPGERIMKETISYLRDLEESKKKATTSYDSEWKKVLIIDENEVGKE